MESTMQSVLQFLIGNSRKLATLACIVLVILMSLSVANTVLFFMEVSHPAGNAAISSPTGTRDRGQIYKLSDIPLFGTAAEKKATQEIVDAPETRLNLELQGVFISEDGDRSTAIVAEKNKTGELFEIGDRLPGNATLSAVHVDHVLIKRGSRIEKLMFSDSAYRAGTSGTSPAAANQTAATSSGNRSRLQQLRDRIRNNDSRPQEPGVTDGTNPGRQALNNYQQKLQENPDTALAEAGVEAVSTGESKGYRIGDDAQSAIRQAGLQPGDVILSVNGRAVGNATSDADLLGQVMRSSRVRVEVQRGKRRFFLTVPVPK